MAMNSTEKSAHFDNDNNNNNDNNGDVSVINSSSFSRNEEDDQTVAYGGEYENSEGRNDEGEEEKTKDLDTGLDLIFEEIDQFISILSFSEHKSAPLEFSIVVEKFMKRIGSKIEKYEPGESGSKFGQLPEEDSSFLASVNRLSKLIAALTDFQTKSKSKVFMPLLNQASVVLHRAMLFMEEELRFLLDPIPDSKTSDSSKNLKGRQQSMASNNQEHQGDCCTLPDRSTDQQSEEETFPSLSSETVSKINAIANLMIAGGYESECYNAFIVARRHAFEEELKKEGFDKISVDDVQKMQWEALEREIATWIRILKRCSGYLLTGENRFYTTVFSGEVTALRREIFSNLAGVVLVQFINFAAAVAMTKRSTEKLFKFLDMYEMLRDVSNSVNSSMYSEESMAELKAEISVAGSRLGEAVVLIFCELENSIKMDNAKTPVASGAVHPLTRYTVNYLKYACEYKDTLEQVFQQHLRTDQTEEFSSDQTKSHTKKSSDQDETNQTNDQEEKQTPFQSQLMTIMDLLESNLESKSNLYKEPSLRFIFLMNNGRYILQKIRGSPEIHQVVGDNWCRKRSSDMRHYHKSYQRETWSKVLQCLNMEGLQVNGKVSKPVLKERFKSFNQQFDEIHKAQSTWVVSDEQLQSELRVSISAVMIPAYRSFMARFGQHFTPGRQSEKYIKYQPEDIESAIEELFDGNPNSMARRRT